MAERFSNKNSHYESQFKEAQALSGYPDLDIKPKEYPNQSYKEPFQYYDSKVINSHLYPNMFYIRPYDVEDVRSDDMVYKSIEARKQYAFGPYILDNREMKVWS
jgi:hypothetical protein